MYVLILILYFSVHAASGAHVITTDFSTKENCQRAGAAAEAATRGTGKKIVWSCTPK